MLAPYVHQEPWSDGIKGPGLSFFLDLVLLMLVVFINCCLGFLCCHLVVHVSVLPPVGHI